MDLIDNADVQRVLVRRKLWLLHTAAILYVYELYACYRSPFLWVQTSRFSYRIFKAAGLVCWLRVFIAECVPQVDFTEGGKVIGSGEAASSAVALLQLMLPLDIRLRKHPLLCDLSFSRCKVFDVPTTIIQRHAVCHGPIAFNHVKINNGDFLAKGKKVRLTQASCLLTYNLMSSVTWAITGAYSAGFPEAHPNQSVSRDMPCDNTATSCAVLSSGYS